LDNRDSNTRVLISLRSHDYCQATIFLALRARLLPSHNILSPAGTIIAGRQFSSHLFSTEKESSNDGSFCFSSAFDIDNGPIMERKRTENGSV
jgi:hypothetical protein